MINLNINKKIIFGALRNTSLVILGTALLAFGTAVFLFPFGLITGGVAGLSIIVEQALSGALSKDSAAAILTWLTFFVGLAVLGRSFAIKTLVSTLVYPPSLSLAMLLVSDNVLNGYFSLDGNESSLILAAAAGGALIGAGCALSFLGGGSTGGTDVFAFIICKRFPKLKSSKVIFAIDAMIILLGAFIMRDLVITLLGIFSALTAALVIDKIFLRGERAFIAAIVSDRYDYIATLIINELGRTATIIDTVGAYSGEHKIMLTVSFTMTEYSKLMSIVNRVDPSAFITVHAAHEIGGEGWTK
ncbi:MAG: YitT family protein [Clostridia bacterium]|nr:YitT family protein [Clostridia bacterium]